MRTKGNGESAAYFIDIDKEIQEFKDFKLPKLSTIIYVEEDLKIFKTGLLKVRTGIYKVIEEYPEFFRCLKIGPSPFIKEYNITESFQKNEFLKGFYKYKVIKEEELDKYMNNNTII